MNIKFYKIMSYNDLLNKISEIDLPISIAHKIYISQHDINPHTDYYSQQINKIYFEYLQKDDEGRYISTDNSGFLIIKGKEEELKNKLEELNNMEIDIELKSFITVDDLLSTNITISAKEISIIYEVSELINHSKEY